MTPVVLVVEDEVLVAWDIVATLEDAGCSILGPYSDVESALVSLADTTPDCAVLDVQVRDRDVAEVARVLVERGVPIVFHSGHVQEHPLAHRFPGAAFCPKPCTALSLQRAVTDLLGSTAA